LSAKILYFFPQKEENLEQVFKPICKNRYQEKHRPIEMAKTEKFTTLLTGLIFYTLSKEYKMDLSALF
jgi:hypothetical protein